jgi:hypothetical protein
MAVYARQAIETRYLGPTNHRGSRVVATYDGGNTYTEWNDVLDVLPNHTAAAQRLAEKLGWPGPFHVGGTKRGYVFVHVEPGTLAFGGAE